MSFANYLIERNSNALTVYHGTGSDFDMFSSEFARVANDYYGGGVAYFTDNVEVAHGYASDGQKRDGSTGTKILMTVEITPSKIFDVDAMIPGPDVTRLMGKTKPEEFLRAAGMLNINSDKFSLIGKIKNERLEMTGDQLFKALSMGQVKSSRARNALKAAGYDALRYNGGIQTQGVHHNVYIMYNASAIRVISKEQI